MAASHVPIPRAVECSSDAADNLASFKEAFDDYSIATGLDAKTDAVQVATLRSLLGDECRKVIKTLNLSSVATATTDGILTALTNHFTSRRNTLYQRFLFRTSTQQPSETVDQFYVRLQTSVRACKYRDHSMETDLVTDQLVLGSRDKRTRADLFRAPDLPTLSEALEALQVSESAQTELKHVEAETTQTVQAESDNVNYVHHRPRSQSLPQRRPGPQTRRASSASRGGGRSSFRQFSNTNMSCQFCGMQHAKGGQCPAYGKTCNFCKRLNHFESVCRAKSRQSVNLLEEYQPYQSGTNDQDMLYYVQEPVASGYHQLANMSYHSPREDNRFHSEDFFHIEEISLGQKRPSLPDEIHTVQTEGARRKLFCSLLIHEPNRQPQALHCQLDTGATCNVINLQDFQGIHRTSSAFTPMPYKGLTLYDGSVLRLVGETTLICSVGNKKQKLDFKIIRGPHKPPLLSAKSCVELGLITVSEACHAVEIQSQGPSIMKQAAISANTIIDNYLDVFEGLGEFPAVYTIEVDKSVPPVQHLPRRVPVALMDPLKEKLDELERRGIVAKVTTPTDWISSLVLVQKKHKTQTRDGQVKKSIRICIDPKDLNKAIKRAKYPMPILDDILPSLSNAKVFSVLDAKDGFYQIRLSEESSFLTTFWTPFGRFRYLRMPFGISSAPEEFQRQMLELLEGLRGVFDIHDDILVVGCGVSIEDAISDHHRNLEALLARARERNLKFNKEKIRLALTDVTYMGHQITQNGIKPDPAKIQAIADMPPPEDKKGLQRFLGSINYVSRFLPAMSTTSEPLRQLLEKDVLFTWQSSQEYAFKQLKKMLTEAPVLAYYNHEKDVTVQCDASESGLGAVLLQEGRPVAYASRALTSSEINYAQIEKECLGIVFACGRFEHYIGGRNKVTVETDHKPLIPIFTKPLRLAPKRLQRMLLQLQSHTLQVEYKPGPMLHIADMLSRSFLPYAGPSQLPSIDIYNMEEEMFQDIASIEPERYLPVSSTTMEEIRVATRNDDLLQKLKRVILKGWPQAQKDLTVGLRCYWHTRDEYTVDQDLIYKGQRLIIPETMKKAILKRLHYSHVGSAATIRKARETVYWPGIEKEIEHYVDSCQSCQTFLTKQYREPLKPFEIPTLPWQMVAQDIFTLNNVNYLVTVDYYSGYWELDVLKDMTASTLVKSTTAHFARHGIPQVLITDNGTNFVGREYAAFSTKWGFLHVTTSPYHSRANGKAEATVKIVKNLLKKVEFAKQDVMLAILEWRNTPNKDGTTPAQKLFSRQTKSLIPMAPEKLKPAVVKNVPHVIAARQQSMKRFYDKGTRALPPISKGERVKIDPRRRHSPWLAATCEAIVGPRSYLLRTDQGSLLRRNRQDIRVERKHWQSRLNQSQAISTQSHAMGVMTWDRPRVNLGRNGRPNIDPDKRAGIDPDKRANIDPDEQLNVDLDERPNTDPDEQLNADLNERPNIDPDDRVNTDVDNRANTNLNEGDISDLNVEDKTQGMSEPIKPDLITRRCLRPRHKIKMPNKYHGGTAEYGIRNS